MDLPIEEVSAQPVVAVENDVASPVAEQVDPTPEVVTPVVEEPVNQPVDSTAGEVAPPPPLPIEAQLANDLRNVIIGRYGNLLTNTAAIGVLEQLKYEILSFRPVQ